MISNQNYGTHVSEYLWFNALLPADFSKELIFWTREANRSCGLSETLLQPPLIVPLLNNYRVLDFAKVKQDIVNYLEEQGKVTAISGSIGLYQNTVCLPLEFTADSEAGMKAWVKSFIINMEASAGSKKLCWFRMSFFSVK